MIVFCGTALARRFEANSHHHPPALTMTPQVIASPGVQPCRCPAGASQVGGASLRGGRRQQRLLRAAAASQRLGGAASGAGPAAPPSAEGDGTGSHHGGVDLRGAVGT